MSGIHFLGGAVIFQLSLSIGWVAYAQSQSPIETGTSRTVTRVQVIPVAFMGRGKPGDYVWMRGQPEYRAAYFVFNDNEEQFLAHQKDLTGIDGCAAGGGNAGIRPWQCETPPRASGVPTGNLVEGGYQILTPHVKEIIDQAVERIKSDVSYYGFEQVVYSSCVKGSSQNCTLDDDLGTGIFHPSEEVRGYIVRELKKISQ
jgi:hypothetical protein